MRREHLVFLLVGLAFGILGGYAFFHAVENEPAVPGAVAQNVPAPAGPRAPGQGGAGDGGAPMMEELEALKKKLEDDPDDLQSLLRVGDLYRMVNMWEEAGQFYERAAETHPGEPGLRRGLAHLFHDNQQWERAIRFYDLALEQEPGDPDLLTDQGICYRATGAYDRALEGFAAAIATNSEHWQAWFNTVVVSGFDLEREDQANEALARLETLRPGDADVARLRERLAAHLAEAG